MSPTPKNKVPLEVKIYLNKFVPRDYQKDFIYNFQNRHEKGLSKFMLVWPRRAGKDLLSFQLLLHEALKVTGQYFLVYPTYNQAKKIIFGSVTSGEKGTERLRYVDFMPKEIVKSLNKQEMRWELFNNSVIQCVGSQDVDKLVGVSIQGAIFSEYAKQRPDVYKYLRPAIMESNGFSIFISTPRGRHNHFYDLYNISKGASDWYSQHYTIEDTKHIPIETIEKDITNGEYTRDHALQEFWTRFDVGIEGTYYGKYLDDMYREGHIGDVPHEPSYPVHCAWDIGFRDHTSIIFFQKIGESVRIIRSYESSHESLEHYVQYVLKLRDSHGYVLGKQIAPHDVQVHEYSTGITRIEKASRLGIHFTRLTRDDTFAVQDGIDEVRTVLSRVRIDEVHAEGLIVALSNYRKEWNQKKEDYSDKPYHDKHSHYADSMRYLAVGLHKLEEGRHTAKELEESFLKHKYDVNAGKGFFNSFNRRR